MNMYAKCCAYTHKQKKVGSGGFFIVKSTLVHCTLSFTYSGEGSASPPKTSTNTNVFVCQININRNLPSGLFITYKTIHMSAVNRHKTLHNTITCIHPKFYICTQYRKIEQNNRNSVLELSLVNNLQKALHIIFSHITLYICSQYVRIVIHYKRQR